MNHIECSLCGRHAIHIRALLRHWLNEHGRNPYAVRAKEE